MDRRMGMVGMALWCAGVLAALPAGALAQSPNDAPAATGQASGPVLKLNPLEELRKFEPAADEEYRLGRGDEIQVDFSGRPEMQLKTVIGPDGRVTIPSAGEAMLNGLSRTEAAHAIEAALANYYNNIAVQVSVSKYTANRVLVLGAVEHPGMVTFDGTPTLMEALTRGGLMAPGAKSAQIPERCAIYRGSDKVLWVELRTLMESGNALADLRLRRDDVVYVPDISERFVSVMGEVGHPGAVPLTHGSNLATVLADAGGITEKAGSNPRIQIIDPASGKTRSINYKDLLNPAKTLEVLPKPGEIVYVPRSGFNRAAYALEKLSPLLSVFTVAAYAGML